MWLRKITCLLGAVAAWPLAAHAQQGSAMRRIGLLMGPSADDSESIRNFAGDLIRKSPPS